MSLTSIKLITTTNGLSIFFTRLLLPSTSAPWQHGSRDHRLLSEQPQGDPSRRKGCAMNQRSMTRLAGLRRSFPTFRLIVAPFRWIGRSKRRIWVAVLTALAMFAAPSLWWWTQLWGLPDIGEPFDVAAFRAFKIPDDRNAFVLYREAADRLKPWDPHRKVAGNKADLKSSWSKAVPELRNWLLENREAMDLYRQASERPDALDPDILEFRRRWQSFQSMNYFQFLALLEASRREEQGDLAGTVGLVPRGTPSQPSRRDAQFGQQAAHRSEVANRRPCSSDWLVRRLENDPGDAPPSPR